MNRNVDVLYSPLRIVSLVPSQTELLFDLGLDKQVVGITKFCVHPEEWMKTKTIVGGTKKLWLDKIDELKPDLIIGNKEENTQEDIAALEKKWPVWMSDVVDIESALQMIASVADITNKQARGQEMIFAIRQSLSKLPVFEPLRTLYLIWHNPWMAAGRSTFIDSMIMSAGLANAIESARYPELTDQQITDLNPEVVLLSSEPFPFKEVHIEKLKALLPQAKIVIVDGEMFSWYGSRMRLVGEYFESLKVDLAKRK
jgi:ABC-type Fe3+-hydroxamate transport system substrate-binding protein